MRFDAVRIAGAGLAGLSAALALARRGARVDLYERRAAAAAPRPHRWDAIENWSTRADFVHALAACAIDTGLLRAPRVEVRAFDGEPHPLASERPLLYVVGRGDGAGCLDSALETHARELGVHFHRGTTLPPGLADIWATGTPRRGFFLDAGVTFRTGLDDQVTILVDPSLTPRACAYLIALDGCATLAVLLTQDFGHARAHLQATLAAFQRVRPFTMHAPRLRSGFGGAPALFPPPATGPLRVGEAGGLIDYLWGFGIRHALTSGALAARAVLEGRDYRQLLETELAPLVRASLLNRRLYDHAGRRLCRTLVRKVCAHDDVGAVLHRAYQPRRLRRWCWPLVAPTFARANS